MSGELKNDFALRLESGRPSESAQRKAYLELRETPDNIAKGLKELKVLLEAEKDLITPISNNDWLLMFLRCCKFYPESARDLIKRYYATRYKYSEVRRMLVPSRLKHVFDANLISILPQRDQCGRRIIVTLNNKQWDYRAISAHDLFSSSILCTDIALKEPETQIHGIVYILDLDGFSFGHALQYTPHVLKRFLDFMQIETFVRVKGFHIVNQPNIFVPIFKYLKSVLNPKFASRFLMHGRNYESLHEHIAPECLPACYGGTLGTQLMYSGETYQMLAEHEQLFEDMQKFGPILHK